MDSGSDIGHDALQMRDTIRHALLASLVLLVLTVTADSRPATAQDSAWTPLIDRLAADGFDRAEMTALFRDPSVNLDASIMAHKVDRMLTKQFEPKGPPSKRTLQRSNYAYFLKPWVINWANDFARNNAQALRQAQDRYGVPQDVIVALMLVETKLGTFLGNDQAFPVLASMAACDSLASIQPHLKRLGSAPERAAYADASAKEKADWAYAELKALILYSKALGQSPLTIPGSIYGAIGICQFMPTNALKFGVAMSGAPQADLFKAEDAIVSIANYLVGHGWKPGIDFERQKAVIYAYNHSDLYVLAVMTVADRLYQARTAPQAGKRQASAL